jgi:hypothetical protein
VYNEDHNTTMLVAAVRRVEPNTSFIFYPLPGVSNNIGLNGGTIYRILSRLTTERPDVILITFGPLGPGEAALWKSLKASDAVTVTTRNLAPYRDPAVILISQLKEISR